MQGAARPGRLLGDVRPSKNPTPLWLKYMPCTLSRHAMPCSAVLSSTLGTCSFQISCSVVMAAFISSSVEAARTFFERRGQLGSRKPV